MDKEKVIIGVITGVVILVGAILFFSGSTNPDPLPTPVPSTDKQAVRDFSQILGKKDAKVVLVEFGDYQCPACAAAHPIVKQLLQKYGSSPDFAFSFRNFPLSNIHPNARSAAFAAEAAGRQGKFWQFHDYLYQHQNEWSTAGSVSSYYESVAQGLGLNMDQFRKDSSDRALQLNVITDISDGLAFQVDSTPTFVLNGEKIQLQNFNELDAKIQEAYVKATLNTTPGTSTPAPQQ
ncbi:MAG TPA: thioredoxin domain-containing protein [Patescibacteria group bacterium]|nr:thioredoxin domain-containing protein [Patescibacteria group bacterium]